MTKILLAEADAFSCDMLSRRLQKSGYEVVTAADGREAVAASLHDRPDLILLDLDMPAMDGRNAMRLIKSDVRTFRIPLIILTAHTTPEDVSAALSAGCFSYEAKPVLLRRLIERIEEALEAQRRRHPQDAAAGPAGDHQAPAAGAPPGRQ